MSIDKSRADDYVEIVFDDIIERSENAAMWLHANPEGDACIYVTKGDEERRQVFQSALVASMLDDADLLEDFAFAVTRALSIRSDEERGALPWHDESET